MRLLLAVPLALALPAVLAETATPIRPPALLTYVAFSRAHPASTSVCLARSDGTRRYRFARGGDRPSWSPTGREIAFVRAYARPHRASLVVATARGRILRRLATAGGSPLYPAWSPNGRWIATVGGGYGGLLQLVPVHGGRPRSIAASRTLSASFASPTWTPNSRRLAFSISSAGVPPGVDYQSGVYTVGVDGSGLRLLVPDAYLPAYSPDGTKLVYVLDRDIVVANADGTGGRRITGTAASELYPAWSPDGKLLAFERVVGNRLVIVVSRSDGSRARVAVSSRAYDARLPSWRPEVPLPRARRAACTARLDS